MNFSKTPFCIIDRSMLVGVAGGAARVSAKASGANADTIKMLTQVGDSLKDLSSKNQSSGSDPMMMVMMMMMMGGGGGGGGGAAAAAAPPPPPPPSAPVVKISNSIR